MSVGTRTTRQSAPDLAALQLDNQLCFAIYSASLAMTKLYRPYLAELKLTYPQYVVMMALWQQDGLTVSELGQRVALDSGTLTPLLKRLQTLGYLSRARNPQDERELQIRLTPAGRKLHKPALALHAQIACATECSSAQRKQMTLSLQQLRRSLQAHSRS